ncbi:MYXO-CTERM domain-containing protein [Poseidonocella pacifica]|uniref:MYXO-CTERM domain-containing protein n=1 Tax=Poseidonocella pacifica TaxID=871651 RepID=A0A1I0WMN9_9RHOB|nr:hypothetical protein [Poseidonocella pacifica]SFA89647.1 MYXO-CTERM domain-containing protein [Poseidonocella pacifica]
MISSFKSLGVAALFCVAASMASAVTVKPFDTPLSAGDATYGNAVAMAGESFAGETLSFAAATDLLAKITATINPFFLSPGGVPSNTISLSYAIDADPAIPLAVTTVLIGPGSVGATGLNIFLGAGQTLSFFLNGKAGPSGNQVTFAVETAPAPVPIVPAGALGLTGILALASLRRRKAKAN